MAGIHSRPKFKEKGFLMAEQARVVMGIDPGVFGALVLLGLNKGSVWAPMPETEKATVDLIWKWRDEYQIVFCLLEKIQAIPAERDENGEIKQGMSSSAMFNFGRGDGVLIGSLYSAEINFAEIRPYDWQKILGIPARIKIPKRPKPGYPVPEKEETKTEFKNRLRAKADELFPKAEITRNNADAYLIARTALLIKDNYVR